MANKKLLMKSMSAILAATVAITSSNWMPVTAFAAEETETTAASPEENNQRAAAGGLVDFKSSAGDDKTTKDEANKTVTLENTGGDHFAIYNGLATKIKPVAKN
ncbi:MAG: hypothetical protein OSJ45_15405 [Lachnospiraceae bacterium]|nr:hypothetical protein [Lachnospiraceae bacterium]